MVCIIAVYPLFRNVISAEIQEIRPGARIFPSFMPHRQKISHAPAARRALLRSDGFRIENGTGSAAVLLGHLARQGVEQQPQAWDIILPGIGADVPGHVMVSCSSRKRWTPGKFFPAATTTGGIVHHRRQFQRLFKIYVYKSSNLCYTILSQAWGSNISSLFCGIFSAFLTCILPHTRFCGRII